MKILSEYLSFPIFYILKDSEFVKGITKIIRGYMGRSGTFTTNGDAIATSYSFPHGLASTPTIFHVSAASADAAGISYTTATSTNLVVHYTSAPPSGTNNLTYTWTAK